MQHLEVICAVRPIYGSLSAKGLSLLCYCDVPVMCMEIQEYKAVVHKIHCRLRDTVLYILSSKGLHVIIGNTHPRFLMSSYQNDFIWSCHPNFVTIPLRFIKVKWCCADYCDT
jgi:hypothetical protein